MKTTVSFTCQPMSYKGHELEEIYPDFGVDYPTTVGYQWQACASGPESWDLIIKISAIAAIVGKGFLEELTKDLYNWMKGKVIPVVSKRDNNLGYVAFEFDDIVISINSSCPNNDVLDFLKTFSDLYQKADPAVCTDWIIAPDDGGCLCLLPLPYSVGEMIKKRGEFADQVSITEIIELWKSRSEK